MEIIRVFSILFILKSSKKSEASFSYRCSNRTWPLGDVSMRSFQCKTCIIDIWVHAKNYVLILEPWWIESRDGSPMILKSYLWSGVGYHLATKEQCHVHIHVLILCFNVIVCRVRTYNMRRKVVPPISPS